VAGVPTLDVVIVSYRCREMLRDCLTSLHSHPPASQMAVHVVDNASGDETDEMVRRQFPQVRMTALNENVGFGAGTNIGIREGQGTYILALNPDTRVTAGALDAMLRLMEERPEIGISGCRLELEDGTFDHAAKRSFPTILGAVGHFTRLGRAARARSALAQYRAPEVEAGPIDCVNGAFMLMRRKMLDEIGEFDEGYWMYMEDIDLCYRAARGNWVTWYEPTITVIHIKAGTSGRVRTPRLNYAFHYGMYRFYRKHYAQTRNPVTNAAVYVGVFVKFLVSLARSSFRRRIAAPAARVVGRRAFVNP
jgi:N-acetylglucosaminyl-diphospho-decaprenol L-rhamnosyltransferase